MGVIGGTIYPPAMGLLSVTVGLPVAMFGNVVLALACTIALAAVRWSLGGRRAPPSPRLPEPPRAPATRRLTAGLGPATIRRHEVNTRL